MSVPESNPSDEAASPSSIAAELVSQLKQWKQRLVLAESCTCGAAAAAIGGVPGASNAFCGSAVTYRETTKQAWLGIAEADLKQHTAESQAITNAMATSVLQHTPDATMSAAITGHLGPDAPPEVGGVVFIAVLRRGCELKPRRIVLRSFTRLDRQAEATAELLFAIHRSLWERHPGNAEG